jgi:hypothetical protein
MILTDYGVTLSSAKGLEGILCFAQNDLKNGMTRKLVIKERLYNKEGF